MAASFDPSHPPHRALSASDRNSFGYKTMQSRLPVIITKVINDVYQTYHNLPTTEPDLKEKEKEAKHIISTISELRYELQHDKKFRPLRDSEKDVEEWNQALADYYEDSSWFKASWLFAECYLYRRVKETFAMTQHFRDYDPFHEQKKTVFKSSQKAIVAIAVRLMSPSEDTTVSGAEGLSSLDILVSQGPESKGTEEAFFELAQFCLWGNATDLSLLDNPDLAKVEELQKRMMTSTSSSSNNSSTASLDKQLESNQHQRQPRHGEDAEETELQKHEAKILTNDLNTLWAKVKSLRNGRVDFILDNAGFELYVDLMFADYLVRAGFASEIVFHAKTIPWFVSDVMPVDFQWTLDQLSHASSPDKDSAPFFDPAEPAEQKALKDLGSKWQSYVDQGVWRVTADDFWTSCYSFYHLTSLPSAQELFTEMKKSDLWIFKGDLNYRKLVYDCQWPTTTPFVEAIGPLGSREDVPSLVTFRTCKADVVVGLAEGVEEKMDKKAGDWQVSGEYAVISFKQ